jgi:hypothetical protein
LGNTKYGTVHGVTDNTNPLLPLLVDTRTQATDDATKSPRGYNYNPRLKTVSEGGSISLTIGWSSAKAENTNHNLAFELVKVS